MSNRVYLGILFLLFMVVAAGALVFKDNDTKAKEHKNGRESETASINNRDNFSASPHSPSKKEPRKNTSVVEKIVDARESDIKINPEDYASLYEYALAFERKVKDKYNILPEDEEEYRRWAEERGLENAGSNYDSYDIETLKTLSKQGDILAMDRLARSIRGSRGNLEEAENLYIKSATRGSLKAVEELVSIKQDQLRNFKNRGDSESARRVAIEALAWVKIGKMRGHLNMPNGDLSDFDHYMQQAGIPLRIKDYEKADKLAHQLYNQLQANRNRLGLDDFDNSIPTAFKKVGLDKE